MRKLLLLLCLTTYVAQAQIEDVNSAASDLVFLTEKYISPAAEASVYQSSNGWFTSVKPKKKFEIELSLQYNTLFVPKRKSTFLVDESQLQNLSIQGGATTAVLPTSLGGDNVVVLNGYIDGNPFEFDSPEGINAQTVKHGQVQATIGLWKKTNFIVRYAPNIQIKSTNYSSYGLGLSHNLNQWISSLKDSSFNLAFLGTYSSYFVDDTFTATNLVLGSINGIRVDGKSLGANIIASKTLGDFDVSGAVGITSSTFDYSTKGEGNILLSILNTSLGRLSKNRIDFKANFGVNYNWKDFSINTIATFGTYTNLLFGVNYSFLKNN